MLQTFDTANMSWNSDKKIFTFNMKMMILIFFASSRDDDLDFCDIDSIALSRNCYGKRYTINLIN